MRHEAIHAPVLIALPVQQHEVLQPRWVEHLGDGRDDRVIVVIPARVHERRCLVVDEELIEGEAGLGRPDGNPVDPTDDVVDPRRRHAWRLTEFHRTSNDEFGEPARSYCRLMRDAGFRFGHGVWRVERSVVMARPVVHFEVIGSNPDQLRRYYGDLFGWTFDTPSPVAKEV